MKRIQIKSVLAVAVALLFVFSFVPQTFAANNASHVVTVRVPELLNISADTSNFMLTFSDYVTGSESDTQTVNYTVKANKMTKASGVISGALGTLFTGVDLKADVGVYTKAGGTASLVESEAGYITIGDSATDLADRQVDAGSGLNTRGSLPITYKAVATADLDAGDQQQTLTISFIVQ